MQLEPRPVPSLSPVVLRSYVHATAGILTFILATTPVPHPERLERAIHELQNIGLSLPESPKVGE